MDDQTPKFKTPNHGELIDAEATSFIPPSVNQASPARDIPAGGVTNGSDVVSPIERDAPVVKSGRMRERHRARLTVQKSSCAEGPAKVAVSRCPKVFDSKHCWSSRGLSNLFIQQKMISKSQMKCEREFLALASRYPSVCVSFSQLTLTGGDAGCI
jgi:hypothetical protein